MATLPGGGDARRTMRLLWTTPARDPGRPGPRPQLSLDAVLDAGIAIADERTDALMPMRAVADRLGCTPMALYTYVADKRELLDLLYDRAHAELAAPQGADWRTRTVDWAHGLLELTVRHPWLRDVSPARAVLGPHEQQAMEWLLEALEPARIDAADTAAVVASLFALARSTGGTIADGRRGLEDGDEAEWWRERSHALAWVAPDFARRFPRSAAMGIDPTASATSGATTGATAGATPGRAAEPWVERLARDAFDRAVSLLLDGATAARD